MLDLSLLICTKNSSKSIISCLQSSLKILKAKAELVLVDGCSKDNTIILIQEFLDQNNIVNFKLISQSKPGLYEAFNLAIENATRKKLFFLHSDDVLKCCNQLIRDTQYCNSDVVFYGIEIKGKFFKRKWHVKNLSDINFSSMVLPPHAGMLTNREVYKKIGNFSTDYEISSDFDWMIRLFNSNKVLFSFSDEITYIMRAGGVSNSGLINEIKKFFEDFKILKSHGYFMPFYKVIRKKINKLWQYEIN